MPKTHEEWGHDPGGKMRVSDESAQKQWEAFLDVHKHGIYAFKVSQKERDRMVSMLACAFRFGVCCPDLIDRFPVTFTGRETIQ